MRRPGFLLASLIFFFSCATGDHSSPYLFENLPDESVDLILPEYPLSFYHYPYDPSNEEGSQDVVILPLPTFKEKTAPTTPDTADLVVDVDPSPEEEPDPVEVITEVVSVPAEVNPPNESPAEEPQNEYSLGDISVITLDGNDWVYLGEEGGKRDGFKDRNASRDKSLFSYLFPDEGEYVLLFLRQNNTTGESEEERLSIFVGPPKDPSVQDEMEPAEPIIEGVTIHQTVDMVEEEPVNGSEGELTNRLEQIEEDPEKVGETLEILEYLVNVESDDEKLAEYYYKMAQTLEKNTMFQDLRRAYETYKYIEENFFLTDYYELAGERIRYLDRHFFKLR